MRLFESFFLEIWDRLYLIEQVRVRVVVQSPIVCFVDGTLESEDALHLEVACRVILRHLTVLEGRSEPCLR